MTVDYQRAKQYLSDEQKEIEDIIRAYQDISKIRSIIKTSIGEGNIIGIMQGVAGLKEVLEKYANINATRDYVKAQLADLNNLTEYVDSLYRNDVFHMDIQKSIMKESISRIDERKNQLDELYAKLRPGKG